MTHIIPLSDVEDIIRNRKQFPKNFYFMNAHGEKLSINKVRQHWWDVCEARRDRLYPREWSIVGAGYTGSQP